MASNQQVLSSGSDGDHQYPKFDEKKRKRMESNRESARRSRMRKQQRFEELASELTQLKKQNGIYHEKIESVEKNYCVVDGKNHVLRAQIAELTDRLNSLNSLTQFWADPPIGIPEIPAFLEPWQMTCPELWPLSYSTQPITAPYDARCSEDLCP